MSADVEVAVATPTAVEPFSLRTAIRLIAATSDQADPGALAGEVLAVIADEDLRPALTQMLPDYIASVLRNDRTRNRLVAAGADEDESDAPRLGRSWAQRAQSSESWLKRLDDRIHVADGWKFLADCTADDLLAACNERRDQAIAASVIADEFEQLAKTVADHGVKTLRDLPPNVLRAALSGAL